LYVIKIKNIFKEIELSKTLISVKEVSLFVCLFKNLLLLEYPTT
uniref:Uncharacterized protein n=1 Tax=Amphimedon queenslandica TaxID=400682 RepID=A0A1X7UYX6_AMPQE